MQGHPGAQPQAGNRSQAVGDAWSNGRSGVTESWPLFPIETNPHLIFTVCFDAQFQRSSNRKKSRGQTQETSEGRRPSARRTPVWCSYLFITYYLHTNIYACNSCALLSSPSRETHAMAKRKEEVNKRMRSALQLSSSYQSGVVVFVRFLTRASALSVLEPQTS